MLRTVVILLLSAFSTAERLYVALRQRNVVQLEAALLDVSNPYSVNYGKHWSPSQILDLVAPLEKDVEPLVEYFIQSGFHVSNEGDALVIDGSKHQIERLVSEQVNVKTRFPVLEFIEGRRHGKSLKSLPRVEPVEGVDNGFFGREVALRLYNMSDVPVSGVSGASIEYQGNGGFDPADLAQSQRENGQVDNPIKHIVGPNVGVDVESELDVQMMSEMSNGLDLWFWDTPNWLYGFAVEFFGNEVLPDVISMSWGWAEDSQCQITSCSGTMTSEEYVTRVNTEYVKIGMRGVTIVVSSGDAGAPGRTAETCDGARALNPAFPTSSPWVLSVGATYLNSTTKNVPTGNSSTPLCRDDGCARGLHEVSISLDNVGWTAGGGFEKFLTKRPSWQKGPVATYLTSGVPLPKNKTAWNRAGRGYPDISAVGHACPTYVEGSLNSVDGTSCSSPVIAGILSLLNSHLGNKRLGFVNPLLYSMYASDKRTFNDVTEGHNWCTEEQCCPQRKDGGSEFGFKATPGWDPVTGLGTPNVGQMLSWMTNHNLV